jgi:hypothetical protein
MRKIILICLIPALAIILFIAAQNPVSGLLAEPVAEDLDLGWPHEVMSLLERSCFDCHTSESGNIKAKSKLNFSKWENYKITKKISKLNTISEEVKGKTMPTKKYLQNYPDRALSDEEIGVITTWANAETDKLMEE